MKYSYIGELRNGTWWVNKNGQRRLWDLAKEGCGISLVKKLNCSLHYQMNISQEFRIVNLKIITKGHHSQTRI